VTHLSLAKIFGIRRLQSMIYHVALFAWPLSCFSRTPTCVKCTDGQTDTWQQLIPVLASIARIEVRMNATGVTGLCAAVQDGLITRMCASWQMEFGHDRKLSGRNAELRMVRFSSVIGKPKPNRPMFFRRPLLGSIVTHLVWGEIFCDGTYSISQENRVKEFWK